MTRIYVAGPMTGEPDHGRPAFRAAAEKLRAAGYVVEDPSENGFGERPWEDYLKADLKIVVDCDGIATLPGWPQSRGASLEVRTALALSIPVHPLEHWLAVAEPLAAWEKELLDGRGPRPMTLDELRQHAHEQSQGWFPNLHKSPFDFLVQSALGLAGETGEAVDVIKKWHRHGGAAELNREALGAELADVFVYLLHLCTAADIDLEAEYLAKSALNETRFGKAAS